MLRPKLSILSALALLGVIASISLDALTDWHGAKIAAAVALLLYLGLEVPRVGGVGRVVLTIGLLTAAVVAALSPHAFPILMRGLVDAASLAGLFASVGFLREAAESSPLVRDCGTLMVNQPPGRRYLVLTLGSQLIAVVLNFGVLQLLGTMVVKGNTTEAAGGDERVVAIRQQRMMTALLRGFAMMTVWSPLSVSFAVTQSAIHGVGSASLLPLQAVLAGLLMMLGWSLDRAFFPRAPAPPGKNAMGWAAVMKLAAVIGAVVAGAVMVADVLGVRVVMGTVLAVPPAAFLWLAAQHRRQGVAGAMLAAGGLLSRRLAVSLPAFRNEIALLGGAMFLGTVASAFIVPEQVAGGMAALGLPSVLLSISAAWAVLALASFGIPQILTVSVLGGALAGQGGLGLNPLVLASGLMGAWALSACSTPVGAAILTISRLSGVSTRTVARDWNGRYVALGAFLLGVWMFGLNTVLR